MNKPWDVEMFEYYQGELLKYEELITCSEKKIKNLEDRFECIICLNNERNNLFLPCKHLVCCSSCIKKIKFCPLCQKEISSNIKIYFS